MRKVETKNNSTIADLYYNKQINWFFNKLMVKNDENKVEKSLNKRQMLNLDQDEFESYLSHRDLKLFKKIFENKLNEKRQYSHYDIDVINKTEFFQVIKSLPYFYTLEQFVDLERLFQKIDHDHTDVVSWADVSNYFLLKLRDAQYTQSLKQMPFNNKPIIKFSSHNKSEITVKFLKMNQLNRYINITRKGSVAIWTKSFKLIKNFQIPETTNQIGTHNLSTSKRTIWIQDAILTESNRLCVSTSKRDLRFFNISSENFSEEFAIYGLPTNPYCLDYYYNKEQSKGFLFYGDNIGGISTFTFKVPKISLYDPKSIAKSAHKILEIHWNKLHLHKDYIEVSNVNVFNDDSIKNIKYVELNNKLVVSSGNLNKSVAIVDPESKMEKYVFNLEKVCSCFDFDMNYHILATACKKSFIYIWDIYSPYKPISKLDTNGTTSISLKIHYPIGYLYSLTTSSHLEVWDLNDDIKIQVIEIDFPFVDSLDIDFGPYPMSFYTTLSESTIIVSCKDYFGYLPIGDNFKKTTSIPISHNAPISCIAYSSLFKIVITCSDDSSITFWNILNGKKFLNISNAHDGEEISVCCLDNHEKTLYTGARNGTIKAWNVANAQPLYVFKQFDESELNGLIMIDKKRLLISMGASKRIVTYTNISFNSFESIRPELLFSGGGLHADDILCCDFHLGLLATGSYDGVINIWTLDSYNLFICIQKKNDDSPIDKLMFLKNSNNLESSILISSENGNIHFWRLKHEKNERMMGKFYSSSFADQSVLALDSNDLGTLLITGDTLGFLYLWDIKSLVIKNEFIEPKLIKMWKTHDDVIVSAKYIRSTISESNELIITASTDWCCRLWTLNGNYIGVFGQENRWNLNDFETFQGLNTNLIYSTQEVKNLNDYEESNKLEFQNINEDKQEYNNQKFRYLDNFKFFGKIKIIKGNNSNKTKASANDLQETNLIKDSMMNKQYENDTLKLPRIYK